jgi:hypothetical protein
VASDLPDRLHRGLDALKTGRPADAVDSLWIVFWDAELANTPDLTDIRLRAGTLLAQALLRCGRIPEVDRVLSEAERLVVERDDENGRQAVTSLRTEWAAARARREAESPLVGRDPLFERPLADLQEVAERGRSIRDRVLARLALAKKLPDETSLHIHKALEEARREQSFTLVGVVVRTAELHGILLPADPYAGKVAP